MVTLCVYCLINLFVWNFYTKSLFGNNVGDLARLGYITYLQDYRNQKTFVPVGLTRKHIDISNWRNEKIDVVTIGDSFSNTNMDYCYQDYLSSLRNMNVLNIRPYKNNKLMETLIVLINSGYLDKIKPDYIIVESIERYCIPMFARQIDFSLTDSISNVENYYRKKALNEGISEVQMINSGNLKFLLYSFLYNYSDRAFFSPVYRKKLAIAAFSTKKQELLFWHEDVKNNSMVTHDTMKALNDNFIKASTKLMQNKIRLYFMPVVNKFTFYQDYILENKHSPSMFFEKIRKLDKNYEIIDTEAILQKSLRNGLQDIFFADDTHWTWKAEKAVIDSISFRK